MKQLAHFFHFLFVPSEKNNYRAKLIQHDLLSMYLCIILLLTIVIKHGDRLGAVSQVLGIATDINIEQLFLHTNEERAKNNLPPLRISSRLSQAAELKADNMFVQNYWAHFAPDGTSPWDFMQQVNYKYEYAGENLAKNFLFSKNVVDAWMDSPTHRENILRDEYTEVGYAIKNGVLNGEETTLVVQMFGKPVVGTEIAEAPAPPVTQQPIPSVSDRGRVLAQVEKPSATPFLPTISIVYLFLGVLVVVFAIDFYIATRLKVIRLHGNSVAHMMFLLFMGAGVVFFLTKGAIL
jgi:hypothetical protein